MAKCVDNPPRQLIKQRPAWPGGVSLARIPNEERRDLPIPTYSWIVVFLRSTGHLAKPKKCAQASLMFVLVQLLFATPVPAMRLRARSHAPEIIRLTIQTAAESDYAQRAEP